MRNIFSEQAELIPFVVSREPFDIAQESLVERSNALLSSAEGHEWNQRRVA